jgi:glucose-6-phosphate 1-epimerase
MNLAALNGLFAIPGHLCFEQGEGGLTKAVVDNHYARCELYLHGAHVTSFAPKGAGELLWLSKSAAYSEGKAIRGGVPICWPWFGPDPEAKGRAQHGFARNRLWTLFGTSVNGRGETVLRLGLQDSDETMALWPHAFALEYTVTVGESLGMELMTRNSGDTPFTISQALHSYLEVDDVENVTIAGLEGCFYLDKLLPGERAVQEGALTFTGETDRIYEDDTPSCLLRDGSRSVAVFKSGSKTTVVWNPWEKKAAQMEDFDDEGFRRMVCIETANAASDLRTVAPGESHTISQTVSPGV